MKGKIHKARKPGVTKSQRADLTFPIARIARFLRRGNYANRISDLAAVALGAVL